MTDTIQVDTPDATTEVQEKTVEQRRADLLEDRRARLLGEDDSSQESSQPEIETPDGEEVAEDDSSQEEVETPDSEPEETTEEVLSQTDEIDIESLTEEDIYEIAKLKGIDLEPKENSAWAAQRRKIKELEAALDAEKAAKQEALSIQTTNDAETKLKQTEANIKYWNRKLMLEGESQWSEEAGADVKGVTHDGKFYTAQSIVDMLDKQEAELPELRKSAREAEEARGKVGNLDEVIDGVREKLNLDGDALETYDKLLSNTQFEIVKNLVPDFGVELVELLGLAALQKAGPAKKKVTIKRKAPSEAKAAVSPTGGSARPSAASGKSSEVKRLEKIVSDPKAPIKVRREAQLQIRQLKYS